MTMCRAFRRAPAGACALFIASLLYLPLQTQAANPAPVALRANSVPSFFALTHNRPRKCGPDTAPVPAPPGWRETSRACAWKGLLQMRRWEALPVNGPAACAGRPAQWWAWARPRFGIAPPANGTAWRASWRAHSLASEAGPTRRIAIIEAGDGSAPVATEWSWTPSPRHATRAWQESQWKLLAGAAARLRPPERQDGFAPAAAQLGRAWEQNLNGRAGLVARDGWLWRADGACLRMVAPEPGEAQLHLPYSPEDTRIEQRAAMQVQLARRYPNASWPIPFRLLAPAPGSTRRGAIYEALWNDSALLTGQLWIPAKDDSGTLRARIELPPPAGADNAALVRTVEHELAGVAATWRAQHER
jgi:hypothetical protein